MKHLFLGIILSLFTFSSFAQDYYWVGGSGDWSEYATHWATASGGTTFHTQEPTSTNNVFFDANSFSASGQVITTSGTINCHDMDWSGTTNSPTFNRLDVNTLNVSGSITLAANATYNISKVFLISDETGKTLDFKGDRLVGANVMIIGNGEWNLQSSILSKNIYFQSGTLNTNDFDINVTFNFYLQSTGAKVFNMGSSSITTPGWRVTGSNITLNAGTSTITSNSFLGDENGSGSFNYYNLHLLTSSLGSLKSSASFNEITIDPGTQLELESGATFTANSIIANGDKFNPITMYTTSTGTEATFNVASGTINTSYLILTDVHATGGATFNADQSVDNGNNTGWNITPITSQDYYWVGNGGNWNDVAHWATSSGGSTTYGSYPGQLDNVFFDNNSFNVNNQEVIINTPAQCNNMDWTGASNNPKVMADTDNPINVYGSAIFTNGVSKDIYKLNMLSNNAANTFTSGNTGKFREIKFDGNGEWTLQDSISCNDFSIKNGTVNLNDQPIYATNSFSMYPNPSDLITLNMGNSHVYSNQLAIGDQSPSVITINSETSTIELSENATFDGEGFTFNNVIFNSGIGIIAITTGNNTFTNLTLKPGLQLTMPANKTQTITGDLIMNGTSAEPISIKSSIDGTPTSFSKATGTVEGNYVTLQDNTATGGATFNARGSIDNGNNTGWNFIKLAQAITFDAIGAKTTLDPTFDLTATASSGLALTYVSSDESVATISGSTVTIIGIGTTTITASQSGNGDYEPAPDAQQVLTVTKTSQTITFSPLVSKTIGDPAFDLTATASSGLALTYVSSDESVATISGSTVTIIGAGTTTITASQSGNGDYEPAPNAQQVLTVTKTSQTITFSPLISKTIGDPAFDLTATASSGLAVTYVSSDESVATISGSTVTIIGAGTTTITASQSGNGDYEPAADAQQVLTVTVIKADQSIIFDGLAAKTFGDANFELTATASSGLTITYVSSDLNVATISGSTVTIIGAGTSTITASQVGDGSTNPAPNVEQVLTVNKAEQVITFESIADKLTTDADFDVVASATSGLALSYTIAGPASISGTTVNLNGEGTVTVTASQSGNNNYNAATDVDVSFLVTAALVDQTITFGSLATKTFGDEAFDLSASTTSDLAITYVSSDESVATISGSTVTIIGAGSTIITASQAGDGTYNPATDVEQTLTVSKADQILTLESITDKLTTDAAFDVVTSSSAGLTVSLSISGPASLVGTTITLDGTEGTVTVTATHLGNANYNAATEVSVSFAITTPTLSDQIITFDAIEDQLIENGSLTLIALASSNLALSYEIVNGPASIDGNIITFTGLGMVTIKASQAGNSEFNPATPVEQTFEIVTVTALEVGKTTSISFYPNPAQNAVNIKGTYQALKIININGGVVYQSMEQKNRIDISQLISGNYIMLISTKNGTETHKLVKK